MYARYIPPAKKRDPPQAATFDDAPESVTPGAVLRNSATPYARYIPPPKGEASGSAVVRPRKIVFTDEDLPDPKQNKRKREAEEENSAPEKKEKKSKKSKTATTESNELGDSKKSKKSKNLRDSEDAEEAPKKKSKDKKAKKQKKQDPDADAEADEDSKPLDGQISATAEADSGSKHQTLGADGDSKEVKKTKEKKKKKAKERTSEQEQDQNEGHDSLDKTQKKHKAILDRKEKSLKREPVAKSNVDSTDPDPVAVDGLKDGITEPEVHGLEPLPQPEPVKLDDLKPPSYETLPPWLAAPIRVAAGTRASFTDLGISPEASKVLESKGYKEAFAVQTAAIPLLLPSPDRQGDLVISAATGSGKTLAYVLPMVRDISQGMVTKLRGLIVVPTRELVRQAQEACEVSAGAFAGAGRKRVKIGISMGSQALRQEQSALMKEEQVYDPSGYEKWTSDNKDLDLDGSDDMLPVLDASKPLPGHVIRHVSKVDILICTPGRLVEHINQTPGFSLDYVRWLIVDEADKLLAQSFQQWLDVMMEKLSSDKKGARDFPGSNKSGIRKVILSATMTRDLSLLNSLKLQRPKLIVLEGRGADEDQALAVEGEHVLPDLLKEYVIKVRNPKFKPLYLVDLLNSKHMVPLDAETEAQDPLPEDKEADHSSASGSSDSESDSDSDSDASSTSSPASPTAPFPTTALIFTKSNETALRLSRLLAILSPQLTAHLGTLTSTTRTSERRRTLRAFASGAVRILVASDLVARGVDLPGLAHVVNYDVPAGGAGAYVHRVGRTARAGRGGCAWTLVTMAEAGWFFREVCGEGRGKGDEVGKSVVRRSGKVERVRVIGDGEAGWFSDERVQVYEDALEQLGKEAGEGRKGK
ncbi:P-loop containing nucleoside triphosphate hydrolase protein [Phialemonium atrogriseum]|uniref:ATP-dependent RNA helicase n=1 Tax=Phialemonium atrogriseum TaxID=1093897 RepID=A0AAJ0FRU2_9PEZI|nr:P-loop containing nucleoside triphosphate hydrolase protein [Phialemonium atrogriseum]KAK1772784.1 P-loop containing nucleoside triphosphate hydrolase protein [Phialemonium atrogriseum]